MNIHVDCECLMSIYINFIDFNPKLKLKMACFPVVGFPTSVINHYIANSEHSMTQLTENYFRMPFNIYMMVITFHYMMKYGKRNEQ